MTYAGGPYDRDCVSDCYDHDALRADCPGLDTKNKIHIDKQTIDAQGLCCCVLCVACACSLSQCFITLPSITKCSGSIISFAPQIQVKAFVGTDTGALVARIAAYDRCFFTLRSSLRGMRGHRRFALEAWLGRALQLPCRDLYCLRRAQFVDFENLCWRRSARIHRAHCRIQAGYNISQTMTSQFMFTRRLQICCSNLVPGALRALSTLLNIFNGCPLQILSRIVQVMHASPRPSTRAPANFACMKLGLTWAIFI